MVLAIPGYEDSTEDQVKRVPELTCRLGIQYITEKLAELYVDVYR
jgi:hypothetical protein